MRYLLKIIIVTISLFNILFAQSIKQVIQKGLEGIIRGPYQKPGWREYFMPDRMEIPRDYLPPVINNHPVLWTPSELRSVAYSNNSLSQQWIQIMRQAVLAKQNISNETVVFKRAAIAKNAALLYYIDGNPSYLQQAVFILTHLPDPPAVINLEGGTPGKGWGDFLESAQAIADLMVCYDLVYNHLTPQQRSRFEKVTLSVINQIIDASHYTTRNNHTVVFATAMGMTALVTEHPEQILPYDRNQLYQIALDLLSESLGNISPDGGYSEGPGYAVYISNYLSQFALYQGRVTGHHLFQNPVMEQFILWTLYNIRPTSNLSQFDDSFKRIPPYFIALLPELLPDNAEIQSYISILSSYPSFHTLMGEGILSIKNLTYFQSGKRKFLAMKWYPIYGEAVFKDREILPRYHGIFLAENPDFFADVHEHVEPLAIEISGQNGDIISGAGYGQNTSDPDRFFHTSAFGYSGILINGSGFDVNHLSGDNPYPLYTFHYASPASGAAMATISYQNALVSRSVYFDTSGIFVVYDQSIGDKEHVMTSHFNTPILPVYTENNGFLLHDRTSQHLILPLQIHSAPGLIGFYNNNYYYFEFSSHPSALTSQATIIIPDYLPSMHQYARRDLNSRQTVMELVRADRFRFIRIGLNEGNVMSYPPSDLETDANFWIHAYSGKSIEEQLFLIGAQTIRWHSLKLEFSSPVQMIVARTPNGMECLFSSEDSTCSVKVIDPDNRSVFLNSDQIQHNQPISINPGENRLDIGLVQSNLHTFYRKKGVPFNPLLGKPESLAPSPPYSDWQTSRLQEYVLAQTFNASTEALRYQSYRIFNDSLLMEQGINSALGLLKNNYILYDETYRFKIPHRYRFQGEKENSRWAINESGEFTDRGIRIRWMDLTWKQSSTNDYGLYFTNLTADHYEYRFRNSNSFFQQGLQFTQAPSQKRISQFIYLKKAGIGYHYLLNKDRMEFQQWMWNRRRIQAQLSLFNSDPMKGWQGWWQWQPTWNYTFSVFYRFLKDQNRTWNINASANIRSSGLYLSYRKDHDYRMNRSSTSITGNFFLLTQHTSHQLNLFTLNDDWAVRHSYYYNGNHYYFNALTLLDTRNRIFETSTTLARAVSQESRYRFTLDFRRSDSIRTFSSTLNYLQSMGAVRLGPVLRFMLSNNLENRVFPGLFINFTFLRSYISFMYLEDQYNKENRLRQLQWDASIVTNHTQVISHAILEWVNHRMTFARGRIALHKQTSPGIEFLYHYPEMIWLQGSLIWTF